MIVFALVLHKALSLSRGITTLFAGGLLTFAIGAGATLAWTVAKDCYLGEARSIRIGNANHCYHACKGRRL